MLKKSLNQNPILSRLKLASPKQAREFPDSAPEDPDRFLEWVWNQAKVCERCLLCETRTMVVKPDGTAKSQIMIVGEGPGFLEDLTGIPLVGPPELRASRCNKCSKTWNCFGHRILLDKTTYSGRARTIKCVPDQVFKPTIPDKKKFYIQSAGSMLDGVIQSTWGYKYPRQNWIDRYEETTGNKWQGYSPWYFTNSILCRDWDTKTSKDRSPNNLSREKCEQWLAWQWAAINPKAVVCLGRTALWMFMGSNKAAEAAEFGQTYDTKFGKVVALAHPAHTMRQKNNEVKALGFSQLREGLKKALIIAGLENDQD